MMYGVSNIGFLFEKLNTLDLSRIVCAVAFNFSCKQNRLERIFLPRFCIVQIVSPSALQLFALPFTFPHQKRQDETSKSLILKHFPTNLRNTCLVCHVSKTDQFLQSIWALCIFKTCSGSILNYSVGVNYLKRLKKTRK